MEAQIIIKLLNRKSTSAGTLAFAQILVVLSVKSPESAIGGKTEGSEKKSIQSYL